jgi:hypothetical protein
MLNYLFEISAQQNWQVRQICIKACSLEQVSNEVLNLGIKQAKFQPSLSR